MAVDAVDIDAMKTSELQKLQKTDYETRMKKFIEPRLQGHLIESRIKVRALIKKAMWREDGENYKCIVDLSRTPPDDRTGLSFDVGDVVGYGCKPGNEPTFRYQSPGRFIEYRLSSEAKKNLDDYIKDKHDVSVEISGPNFY